MNHSPGRIVIFVFLAAVLVVSAFAFAPGTASSARSTVGSASKLELSSPANQPERQGGPGDPPGVDPALIQAFRQQARGAVKISNKGSTGKAAAVQAEKGGDLLPGVRNQGPQGKALGFFARYGELFGVQAPDSQLVETETNVDSYGMTHVSYQEVHNGVPVFGGVLRAHVDAQDNLTAVNGVFVPDIAIETSPALSSQTAEQTAIAAVAANPPVDDSTGQVMAVSPSDLQARSSQLFVYQDGLIQGIAGPDYLVYQVEVSDGSGIREFVFVNANTGKIVNRYSGVDSALYRVLYEQSTDNQVWEEGDDFPGTLNDDQQNIVNASGDAYYLYYNAFGRDSYDALGAHMRSVNNDPRISCPNANWNGITTNYCNGVTGDDVVAHEWGHAYTEYTHGLIYQWQPGALNESYSDIWGEVTDMINGRGTDSPAPTRNVGACSTFMDPLPTLSINSPASLAGDYPAGGAAFGPALTEAGTTGDVVLGDDGTGASTDACEPLVNGGAIAGNLALVDRGSCTFVTKVKNAQNAGAIGVIVANNVVGSPITMGGSDLSITIPSIMVSLSTGDKIKAALPGVNATMRLGGSTVSQESYRWLMGEDATAFGGAIRDMWTPNCALDPGKVLEEQYSCSASDGGGVHTNSGVPNHGFSLLVDGGTYNGQTVQGIGLTKAAHIYWNAEANYQTPTSGFPEHADALEMACNSLIGATLNELSTSESGSGTSSEVITAGDCDQVSAMIAAVELRADPTAQCNFTELLAKDPPAACADIPGDSPTPVFSEDFETGLGGWTLSNSGVYAGWPGTDWEQATSLPGDRSGAAAFGADPDSGNCDLNGGDISGKLSMDSPVITLSTDSTIVPRLAFDHYVATELGWDGGNLKISINGGPFNLVPPGAFLYNPYNTSLNTPAAGNTNPMAGEAAFTGTDGGKVTGSWGQSQVDLGRLGAFPGDTVQFRYDMGMDGCTGIDGWYVDDIDLYTCSEGRPTVSVEAGGTCSTANSATVLLEVADAETPAGDLIMHASSSNQALVPDANLVFGGSGSTRTLTITTNGMKSGSAIITVTAYDGISPGKVEIQVIVGTNAKDTLNGSDGVDLIFSLNGKDRVSAGAGNDYVCGWNGESTIYGGAGDDTIYGANGDDALYGEAGNDILSGGRGADFFSGGTGTDTALDFTPSEGDTTDGSIP